MKDKKITPNGLKAVKGCLSCNLSSVSFKIYSHMCVIRHLTQVCCG